MWLGPFISTETFKPSNSISLSSAAERTLQSASPLFFKERLQIR